MLVTLEPCFRLRRMTRMIRLHGGQTFSDQDGGLRADREIKRLSKRKYGVLEKDALIKSPVAFVDKGNFGKRWKARNRKLRTTSMVINKVGPLRCCLEDASEALTIVS